MRLRTPRLLLEMAALTLAFVSAILPASAGPAHAGPPLDPHRTVRFVGPFRWIPIEPDSCGRRATGIAFEGFLDIPAGVGRGDTLAWEGMIEYQGGEVELPACCSCSIEHPLQYLTEPAPGRHRFVFDFCMDPPKVGRRGAMRLGFHPQRWPAPAETSIDLPSFPTGYFDRPAHRIVAVRDRAVDADRDGLADSIEVIARVTSSCAEAVRFSVMSGKDPYSTRTYTTRRVVPPASEVSLFLDARTLHAARDPGPYRVRIEATEPMWNAETVYVTRAYRLANLAPADIELGDGPAHLVRAPERPLMGPRFQIRIPVRVQKPGTWFLRGDVAGASGLSIYSAQDVPLTPGRREIVMELDEGAVLRAKLRGPLTLTRLWAQGDGVSGIRNGRIVTAESVPPPRDP